MQIWTIRWLIDIVVWKKLWWEISNPCTFVIDINKSVFLPLSSHQVSHPLITSTAYRWWTSFLWYLNHTIQLLPYSTAGLLMTSFAIPSFFFFFTIAISSLDHCFWHLHICHGGGHPSIFLILSPSSLEHPDTSITSSYELLMGTIVTTLMTSHQYY